MLSGCEAEAAFSADLAIQSGFIKSAQEFVKVGDAVQVRVLSVDAAAKRVALTMKGLGEWHREPGCRFACLTSPCTPSVQSPAGLHAREFHFPHHPTHPVHPLAGADAEAAAAGGADERSNRGSQRGFDRGGERGFDRGEERGSDRGGERDGERRGTPVAPGEWGDFDLPEEEFQGPKPGFTFEFADALGEDFPFEMEAGLELNEEDVLAFEEDNDVEIAVESDMPVPLQEIVDATVVSATADALKVEFLYNDKKLTGTIEKDELKVPVASLSAEQLAEAKAELMEGDELGNFLDSGEVTDASSLYKVGDQLQAIVLEYTLYDEIRLTMFTDYEVEEQAMELAELDEDDEAEVPVLGIMDDQGSLLALDPLELIMDDENDDADEGAESVGMGVDDNELVTEYQALRRKGDAGLYLKDIELFNLPNRPLVSGWRRRCRCTTCGCTMWGCTTWGCTMGGYTTCGCPMGGCTTCGCTMWGCTTCAELVIYGRH